MSTEYLIPMENVRQENVSEGKQRCKVQKNERTQKLLCQLLDLKTPKITDGMCQFLCQDEVFETLLKFIVYPSNHKRVLGENGLGNAFERSQRAVKLLLHSENEKFKEIIQERFEDIICILVGDVLSEKSSKNFEFFWFTMRHFVLERQDDLLKVIRSNDLFPLLIDRLDSYSICKTLNSILSFQAEETKPKRRNSKLILPQIEPISFSSEQILFFDYLARKDIILQLMKKIFKGTKPIAAEECHNVIEVFADFVCNVVHQYNLLYQEDKGNSFTSILTTMSSPSENYVDLILHCLSNRANSYDCRLCASRILLELITSMNNSPSIDESSLPFKICVYIMNSLGKNFSLLCQIICDEYGQNNSEQERNSFTLLRMNLVYIFFNYLQYFRFIQNHDVLNTYIRQASIDQIFVFKVLINWFFEYPSNNLYHHVFKSIITEFIFMNDPEVLEVIFSEEKLLTRMIRAYLSDQIVDYRGHILSIANLLRIFKETLSPSQYLRHFLSCHGIWKSFQKRLVKDTFIEAFGSLNHDEESISLGSEFAEDFGLYEEDRWVRVRNPRQLKKYNAYLQWKSEDDSIYEF